MTRAEGLAMLRAELERIKADPSTWDQENWVNDCGTSFCLAGGAAYRNKLAFLSNSDFAAFWLVDKNGWSLFTKDYAELFGLEFSEADSLFDPDNDLEQLESILTEMEAAV